MSNFKSFNEFLTESFLYEAEEKKKSKIHPELDTPLRWDWVDKVVSREWKKKHKDEDLQQAINDGDEDKIKEIREKIMKDPQFGPEYTEHRKKSERHEKLLSDLNDAGGLESYKKSNPKEYEELLDLQADHASSFKFTPKPGGMLQITSQDMETYDNEGELAAEAFRKKMKEYIAKNGKPKGVIMDLRTNTGGSQEVAKGMTDFFVDGDEYDIESQKFNWGVRRYKDDPDGLEKYMKDEWDPAIIDHLNKLSDEEKKKFWEESKKKGYFELPNKRKNKVDAKDRLTGIPVVLQTSTRTFSAGEFASDTIKNLNPNTVHIGHNSGGGANMTFTGLDLKHSVGQGGTNAEMSSTEKAKLVANAFKNAYHEEKAGIAVHDAIMKKIESGEITDKTPVEEVAKITKAEAVRITKDAHATVYVEKDGSIETGVPQIRSDRVIVDPKTRKPVLKNGQMQYKGNWEQAGVGNAGTSPFVETDPNTATRDALEYLYLKTGQNKLAKELKTDPEKFGISKDGKDGIYDSSMESKVSDFIKPGEEYDERQGEQYKKSVKNAEISASGKGVADKMLKAENDFKEKIGSKVSAEDLGAKKMFSGVEPDLAEKLRKMKVTIAVPGVGKKQIQTDTLMDFVPIDRNDPEEAAMIKAQAAQYARINKLRAKLNLKPLLDFEVWLEKNIEMAQDNKDYQARLKAKTLKKMRPGAAKESYVEIFNDFLIEEENNKRFIAIVESFGPLYN